MTQTAPKTGTFPVTQLNKPAHCDFHSNVLSLITATDAEVLHLESLGALLCCEILFQGVPETVAGFGMHLAEVGNLFLHQ